MCARTPKVPGMSRTRFQDDLVRLPDKDSNSMTIFIPHTQSITGAIPKRGKSSVEESAIPNTPPIISAVLRIPADIFSLVTNWAALRKPIPQLHSIKSRTGGCGNRVSNTRERMLYMPMTLSEK